MESKEKVYDGGAGIKAAWWWGFSIGEWQSVEQRVDVITNHHIDN